MEEDTKNNTSSTTENPVEPDEVVAAETEDAVADNDNDNNDTSSADGGDSDNDEASNTDMEETQETAGAADSDSDIESIVADEEDDEDTRGVDTSPTKSIDGAPSDDKKRSIDEVTKEVPTHDKDGPLPTLPLKRARTAYFIFADAKRPEVKLQVCVLCDHLFLWLWFVTNLNIKFSQIQLIHI